MKLISQSGAAIWLGLCIGLFLLTGQGRHSLQITLALSGVLSAVVLLPSLMGILLSRKLMLDRDQGPLFSPPVRLVVLTLALVLGALLSYINAIQAGNP